MNDLSHYVVHSVDRHYPAKAGTLNARF